jgi:tetratricopeptide (TPR) repeat protein
MRNYSQQTIKRLFSLSGNLCAFPNCDKLIVNSNGTIIGEICHINALNENGPRFNDKLTENELNDFENLILLCPTCHTTVDKEFNIYTTDKLKQFKNQQIDKFKNNEYSFDPENIYNQINNISIVQHITNNYGIDYNVYNKVIIELSKTQENNELLKKELTSWIEKYKMLKNNLNNILTDNYLIQGKKEFECGNFSESETQYLLSIEKSKKDFDKQQAEKYYIVAILNELQLKYENAFKYYKQALDLDPDNLIYLKEFAYSAYNVDDFELAFDYLQKTLTKFKGRLQRDEFLFSIKQFLEEKLVIAIKNNNDLEIAILQADLGSIYTFLRDLKKAKEFLSKSYDIYKKSFPTSKRKKHVEMSLQMLNNFSDSMILSMVDMMLNNFDTVINFNND